MMLTIGTIPNSDSQLLSAIAFCRIFREYGHKCMIALDPGNPVYQLMKIIAEQEDEKIYRIDEIKKQKFDAILFDSNLLLKEFFSGSFRIDFIPGAYCHEIDSLVIANHFANSNLAFSPNFVQRDFPSVYHGEIPVLGMPSIRLYQRKTPCHKKILYPEGFPWSLSCREEWFRLIKERHADGYVHLPQPSYRSFFNSNSPPNLKLSTFKESTRKEVEDAEILIGIESGIFIEAAALGKQVCLVKDPPLERINGLFREKDYFEKARLRSRENEILSNIQQAAKIDQRSLREFIPEVKESAIVDMVETIFNVFSDEELRNSCKFDIGYSSGYMKDLEKLRRKIEDPPKERIRNLVRAKYYSAISELVKIFLLISPGTSYRQLNDFLEENDFYGSLPSEMKSGEAFIEKQKADAIDKLVGDFYSPENLDSLFTESDHYEADFLALGFNVVLSLERNGRGKDANEYSGKLGQIIQRTPAIPSAKYKIASTLENLGDYSQAKSLFEEILEEAYLEQYLHYGCFYHLGTINVKCGNCSEALKYLERCLEIEQNHIQARRLMNYISSSSIKSRETREFAWNMKQESG
jgi:tetratricopeptide (TPR) repeat protein